jgi:hypothetical protein
MKERAGEFLFYLGSRERGLTLLEEKPNIKESDTGPEMYLHDAAILVQEESAQVLKSAGEVELADLIDQSQIYVEDGQVYVRLPLE